MHTLRKSILGSACAGVLLSLLSSCAGENEMKNNTTETAAAPAATAPAYNLKQQVFCLNVLSNISAHYNGQSDSAIKAQTITAVNKVLADSSVRSYIGRWNCVWGPVVIDSGKNASKMAAMNTMFIAQNADTPNLFVVAIAGTNPKSVAAWKLEDFNVRKTAAWSSYTGGSLKPRVSQGTMDGFNFLNNMQDVNRNNITALAYIQSMMNSFNGQKMRIWVTGHSLGGALSPAYALYLHDTLQSKGQPVDISCLPVAGPTPGNGDFATYYFNSLGSQTVRVWNKRDVVPHGFDPVMLAEVSLIYAKDLIQTPAYVTGPLPVFIGIGQENNYTQLMVGNDSSLTSDFFTLKDRYDQTMLVENFPDQALGQHIPAYAAYFGIGGFQNSVQAVMKMTYPFFSEGLKAPTGKNKIVAQAK